MNFLGGEIFGEGVKNMVVRDGLFIFLGVGGGGGGRAMPPIFQKGSFPLPDMTFSAVPDGGAE